MKIHHLNCGTMCPVGGRFMDGSTAGLGPARLVCHCLLVELPDGLMLIDTGFGLRDVALPRRRLATFFRDLLRLKLAEEETAVRRIEALGFDPRDVRHIVLTHLDFDHAGGIEDFPHAAVHVMADEMTAARHRVSPVARGRYRPAQWNAEIDWRLYRPQGESWFGFESVRDLDGLPPEILFVPLVGHTWGHTGVALRTTDGWLLHAGDAYFYRGEMAPEQRYCTPGLSAYQTLMEVDRARRLANQERLRRLVHSHGDQVRVFSAHDHVEFDDLARQPRALAGSGLPFAAAPAATRARPSGVVIEERAP